MCANRHPLSSTRLFLGDPFPTLVDGDWLIVMGGPMGVHDEALYAWLTEEKRLIEGVIKGGNTVLGICLGAQLIADVLGARVFRNRHKEIGWFPIEMTQESTRTSLFAGLPRRFDTFHWHGDTFDLPAGAIRIARSAACDNQGFLYDKSVVALQFHLETTQAGAAALIEHCAGDIVPAPFIQTPESILASAPRFVQANEKMRLVLDGLSNLAVGASPEV